MISLKDNKMWGGLPHPVILGNDLCRCRQGMGQDDPVERIPRRCETQGMQQYRLVVWDCLEGLFLLNCSQDLIDIDMDSADLDQILRFQEGDGRDQELVFLLKEKGFDGLGQAVGFEEAPYKNMSVEEIAHSKAHVPHQFLLGALIKGLQDLSVDERQQSPAAFRSLLFALHGFILAVGEDDGIPFLVSDAGRDRVYRPFQDPEKFLAQRSGRGGLHRVRT